MKISMRQHIQPERYTCCVVQLTSLKNERNSSLNCIEHNFLKQNRRATLGIRFYLTILARTE